MVAQPIEMITTLHAMASPEYHLMRHPNDYYTPGAAPLDAPALASAFDRVLHIHSTYPDTSGGKL